MNGRLLIVVGLVLLSACSTTKVLYDGPCPPRPYLLAIPVDLQLQMPEDAVLLVDYNQSLLKQHIIDLESLSGCGE